MENEYKYCKRNEFNDVSNVKYIEIIKSEWNETTREEIEGFAYNLLKVTVKD